MKLITTIILIAATLLMGILLTKLGKPYNTGLFTVHKLLALAYCVLLGLLIKDLLKTDSISMMLIFSLVLLILGTLALFATGAMMSIGVSHHKLIRLIHIIGMSGLLLGYAMVLVTKFQNLIKL